MLRESGWKLSAETVRRELHRLGFVGCRPRPVVGPTDPEYAEKLRYLQQLLATLPGDEVAVFQEEVDLHLNPKIGSMWRPGEHGGGRNAGEQPQVSPGRLAGGGDRHAAGQPTRSVAQYGAVSGASGRSAGRRSWKRIHVSCDNAAFHKSRKVPKYLARWGHRISLHSLAKDAPETNPIERVWGHLHETITRHHRCVAPEELCVRRMPGSPRTEPTLSRCVGPSPKPLLDSHSGLMEVLFRVGKPP
jgi:hypothetical protein